jgi:dTDP-glucose pyrophosphorylase
MEFFKANKGNIMSLARVDNPGRYGVVTLKGNLVSEIIEKPKIPESDLINAGIYVFTPDIFNAISDTPRSARG